MPKQMWVAAPADGTDEKNATTPRLAVIIPAFKPEALDFRPALG